MTLSADMFEASLCDTHIHLGFFNDPLGAASKLSTSGISAICATVEPQEYVQLCALGLDKLPGIFLGVGLHPWWIADGRCDAQDTKKAAELAAESRYVSEIGLDFSHGRDATSSEQIYSFETLLEACSDGGHVLSLHSIDSAAEVLNLLEAHRTCENNDVIFHWFTGSGESLTCARNLGCYFSINPRMLKTRRGRAYAQQISAKQLLLETDLPANRGDALDIDALAQELKATLAFLVETHEEETSGIIASTSAKLSNL